MAGLPQAVIDFVRLVEIRVVDQTLPADGGAGLFEVHPHYDVQLVRVLVDRGLQQGGIFTCSFGVVNPTGGYHRRAGCARSPPAPEISWPTPSPWWEVPPRGRPAAVRL